MDYGRSGEGYQMWIAVQKRKALLNLLLCGTNRPTAVSERA